MASLIDQLISIGVGRRHPNDPFFSVGDAVCKATERLGVYDVDEEEFCHEGTKLFSCDIPGCKAVFESVMLYEMHYNSQHRNPCSVCKKQFPSAHLLDLHILESHDSFFKVQAERKPMFSCFVEDCSLKFSSSKDRRDHCISEHRFPHDFRFDTSSRDSTSSKKKAKKAAPGGKKPTDEPMEEENGSSAASGSGSGSGTSHPKNVVLGRGKRGRMWSGRHREKASGDASGVHFDSVTQELRENLPDDEMSG